MAEAEKMGMKLIEEFWTLGASSVVALFEAPDGTKRRQSLPFSGNG